MTDTIKISNVVELLNEAFPLSAQDSWDNSGLIIGNRDRLLKGILFTVDITSERVEEAVERGCNMIVSHHPILFRGTKRINGNTDEERTIISAIKNDIAICAFHTPADKSSEGLSKVLGEKLGLCEMKPLIPEPGDAETGYGVIGTMERGLEADEFLGLLAERLGCETIRHSEYGHKVKRVAICTGSGSEFITDAIKAKADAYVTGDVKYHQFQQAEGRMMITDVGHYESEEACKKLFLDILMKKFAERQINFSNFALCISTTCSNVIKYYSR